ncbi:MAG: N-6 DNA methylase [Bacteroidota bacterium]|nr:N-6 DNA methylase [Bacteroidota bacterium]
MAATLFENNIEQLKFSFLEKKEESDKSGVVLTAGYEKLDRLSISPDILFALETAKEKFDADAVYFRYFDDGRGAIPQIYIYDNTNNQLTDKKREIHIKVWSGCQVPMYIIIEKSDATIFDARERAKENKETKAYETIKLTGEVIKEFTAKSFDDGLFWEEKVNEKHFQFKGSAYRDLITGLKKVFDSFQKNSGLDNHIALKLLVQCLLIKYLEERDAKSKNGYFAATYFQKNFGCFDFCGVIRAGKLLELLDQLAGDFNGKIFEWHPDDEDDARKLIVRSEVKQLANYLDGKSKDDHFVIWRLYSFSHLPVELISSVYEELLTNSKDIVYTPEMVVSTLVDECMPLKNPRENFKLIDVSCGSGIFIVKAYKRIIQWWRYTRWQQTGQLEKPSLETLKQLLLDSIYGIDIQEDAIRLSVFSLALALLDEVDLKPPVWQELKFPDLSKQNIIVNDFFKHIASNPVNDFDLVIGNPPFNPPKEDDGKPISNGVYFNQLKDKYNYTSEIKIPDENPALHFLVQAMRLLKPEAMLCLIQPSGPLLYQKDTEFKQALFSKYNLLQVLDFTKLADVLWGKKNVATAAVFLQNTDPDDKDVAHIVANRTFSNVTRLFLEFDHYDFHWVSKDAVLNSSFVWKANLLGGGRLNQFVERLAELPTLGDYLKSKRKNNGWVFGDGFIKGKPDDELTPTDFEKKKGGYSAALFLTGSKYFEPEDFDENGIKKTGVILDNFFQWKRQPELFQAPLLLIKKNIGKKSIPVLFSEESIAFKNEIIGVHAPVKERDSLTMIESMIRNNQAIRFYISITSSRSGISRSSSTLLQEDILNMPFSEESYGISLSNAEKLLIYDVLSYQLDNGKQSLGRTTTFSEIIDFSNIFRQTLNSVYQIGNKAFRLFKVLDAGRYFAIHFEYTDQNYKPVNDTKANLEDYIQQVIPTGEVRGNGFHIQRIMKIYGKDCIILVKPKQLRYWLPSIALRDADEAFADYIKARYY